MTTWRFRSLRADRRLPAVLALFAAVLVCPLPTVSAAVITWGQPHDVMAPIIDVSTTGTLVYAYNVGTSSVAATTVNGVTFQAAGFPASGSTNTTTIGSISFTESPGQLYSYATLGSSQAPYSGLAAEYQALLNQGGSADLPFTLTLQVGGLTSGQDYLIQWWTSNASNTSVGVSLAETSGTAGNAVTLDANTADSDGGLGQYVIGTFTADATSQSVAFDGAGAFLNARPLVNAFQVRAVPEPMTLGLFGAAGVFGVFLARRSGTRLRAEEEE